MARYGPPAGGRLYSPLRQTQHTGSQNTLTHSRYGEAGDLPGGQRSAMKTVTALRFLPFPVDSKRGPRGENRNALRFWVPGIVKRRGGARHTEHRRNRGPSFFRGFSIPRQAGRSRSSARTPDPQRPRPTGKGGAVFRRSRSTSYAADSRRSLAVLPNRVAGFRLGHAWAARRFRD